MFTRRQWLTRALQFLLGFGFIKFVPVVNASTGTRKSAGPPSSIGETFAFETMVFTAGFLIFPHAGDAVIKLVPLPGTGRYRATLSGKTRGVIAFFTRHREDTHTSELIETPDHSRFICTRLIRDTKIGKDHTIKIFEMDYQKRLLTVTRLKRGKKSVHVKPIPPGVIYDDPLTAFYNFRFGVYGSAQFGKRYVIDTIPGKKVKHIYLRVASKERTEKKKRYLSISNKVKYLVTLRIAPEIVKSKKGEIEGWLTPDLVPLYGVAKDVIFFGDVEGKLVQRRWDINPPPPL